VELRSAVRYPIAASVVFSWQGPQGPLQGEGVTRDISKAGAYIRTPTTPPLAVAVQMEIFLPPIEPERRAVKVLSEGRVIRVEHPSADDAQSGFAALTEGSSIIRTTGEFGDASETGRTAGDD
jgi:PilZ domain